MNNKKRRSLIKNRTGEEASQNNLKIMYREETKFPAKNKKIHVCFLTYKSTRWRNYLPVIPGVNKTMNIEVSWWNMKGDEENRIS